MVMIYLEWEIRKKIMKKAIENILKGKSIIIRWCAKAATKNSIDRGLIRSLLESMFVVSVRVSLR